MGSYGIQHHKEDSFHTVEYMFLTNWEHNIHIQIEDTLHLCTHLLSDPPINTYINMLLYSPPTPQKWDDNRQNILFRFVLY